MRIIIILCLIVLVLPSCHSVGDKTKKVLNKTGQAIGEGSSEFVKGVGQGIDNTFDCSITVSSGLSQNGISFGKFSITNDTNSSTKNKLIAYLIFNQDYDEFVSAKLFDHKGNEYGRTTAAVSGKKGEAHFVDFIFDRRTDVESKSKFLLE